jgi:aquaporin Z
MEVKGGDKKKFGVLLTEFLGTSMLISTINWSNTSGNLQASAIAILIFTQVLLYGHISGGHFNPAVTVAIWTYKHRNQYVFMLMIILA